MSGSQQLQCWIEEPLSQLKQFPVATSSVPLKTKTNAQAAGGVRKTASSRSNFQGWRHEIARLHSCQKRETFQLFFILSEMLETPFI